MHPLTLQKRIVKAIMFKRSGFCTLCFLLTALVCQGCQLPPCYPRSQNGCLLNLKNLGPDTGMGHLVVAGGFAGKIGPQSWQDRGSN